MALEIDLLIKGARVYDGTGGKPFTGDTAVSKDRISFVSRAPQAVKAGRIIDAEGLSLSPGFIDAHSHSDFTLFADGRAEGKVFQGVTTEINGNCGLSAAPLYGEALEHRASDLKELGIDDEWSTLREYFELIEKKRFALNCATLAGHGNIRASVIGYRSGDPGRSEKERMKALLKCAVDDGAIGLSTGLIYPPGVFSKRDEIVELMKGSGCSIYTSHMRSEGDRLVEAVEETIKIGKGSGVPAHISHIKTGGERNWHKIDRVISVIERERSEGMRLTCDRYPYTASSTDLDAVLPSWTYEGGAGEELKRLRDPHTRQRIKGEIASRDPSPEFWGSLSVSSVQSESNKWMEGETLWAVAERLHKEPVEVLLDILAEERLRVGAIFYSMNEDNLRRFLSLPYLMIGSDSSARSSDGPTHTGKPHPRGFGTFPRFLGKYAFRLKLMSIERAVHKMTALTADTFGLKWRGRVAPGYFADLVIFDEKRIIDRATFKEPFLKAEGIHYVLVNGSPVVWEGVSTGRMPGRALRNGG